MFRLHPGNFLVLLLVVSILHSPFSILNSHAVQLPKTGQTVSYAAGDDGGLERGVAWPAARFASHDNGTVTDSLTGLMWATDANLMASRDPGYASNGGYGNVNWQQALDYIKMLNAEHYLGYSDWRLPNRKELRSLVDISRYNPALPNGHPFINVQAYGYWSSSTAAYYTDLHSSAWVVHMWDSTVDTNNKYLNVGCVWPVRGGQVGSFGYSGIFFSPIPAQSVNTPFDVTVSACDANGVGLTGWVFLSLASGNLIKPTNAVYLLNGSGNVQLTIPSPEADTRIIGTGLGFFGSSNYFTVSSVSGSTTGVLTGKVLSKSTHTPLIGVSVVINGVSNGFSATVATDSTGRYYKNDIPAGDYQLYADNGALCSMTVTCGVNAGTVQTADLEIASTRKPPVLILAGVMGSTKISANRFGYYPDLPAGYVSAGNLKILNPLKDYVGIKKLSDELDNYGFDVTPVPWDWRKDTDWAVNEYLKRAIDKAKQSTGYAKVDIVAHSQGGLLTRAYIQGSNYQKDIDRFIMVGTPNQGSAIPYWILEGGDPKTIDDITGSTAPWYTTEGVQGRLINFYSNVANNLYKAATGSNAFNTCVESYWWDILLGGNQYTICVTESLGSGMDFNTMKIDKKKLKDFLNDNLPGPKKLMASYDGFLRDERKNSTINVAMNSWLQDLNNNATGLGKMIPIDSSDTDPDKVRTVLLLSTGEKTLKTVNVDSDNTSLYRYGQPRGSQNLNNFGDGTVPSDKAAEPLQDQDHAKIDQPNDVGVHASLLGAFTTNISAYLRQGRPLTASVKEVSSRSAAAEALPMATLSVSLTGRVQPFLVDPNGKADGVNPQTGTFSEEIPSSNTVLNMGSSLIEIDSPTDGTFTVSFKGQTDDIYNLSVSFTDGAVTETRSFRGVHHNSVTTLTFTLTSTASPKLTVTIPAAPPSAVASANVGDIARISWTASTDPAVAYDVYARRFDQPSFSLLGSTAGIAYNTSHPWNTSATGESWSYLVIARKADGKESFFETIAENRDYLVANFSSDKIQGMAPLSVFFTDSSTSTVTGRQWDFDGDGVTDSTDTNPVHIYNTPGVYTVTLTVTGPNGSDFQTRTNYITVDSTPPDTIIGDTPANPTNVTQASFTFTATKANSTFECRLDGAAFSVCTSTMSYSGLTEGSHTFDVRAIDPLGNTDATPASYTWTIDLTPPVNGVLKTSVDYGQVSLAWSGFSDTGSGIREYRLVWDATSVPASCAAGALLYAGSGESFVQTGLTTGATYYYRLCATDKVGNSSVGVTASAKVVDTSPPTGAISINKGAPYARFATVKLTLSADDPSGIAQMCISNTDTCKSWVTFAAVKNWNLARGDGIKTVKVWFKDKAGNANSNPYSATIILDSKLTLLTINPVITPISETSQTITGTVEEGATVRVTGTRASSGAASVSGGDWSYAVTGLRKGVNILIVTATDVAGNTAEKTVRIRVK